MKSNVFKPSDVIWNSKNWTLGAITPPPPPSISFIGLDGLEIMKFESNGDIYVKGNLVENDKVVVDGIREFLSLHNRTTNTRKL